MNPDRYKRVEEVLQRALSQPPERVDSFLREACGDDEELRREVESLIAHERQAGSLLAFEPWSAAMNPTEQKEEDFSGRNFLHYRLVEKIGQGGMGVVYRAEDTHLRRPVAIKLLPAGKMSDPDSKRRFIHEARAASALNHPNIVTIHDITSAEGLDFIAMEYVAGKPLSQLITGKGLPIRETLKYAIQIADALARAHKAGIIHRDLKPSNILVTDEGSIKILDFGLAKLMHGILPHSPETSRLSESLTESGAILGTVAYMSPEQAEGEEVDERSDIFAFGALLYEMVTGRQAFQGDSTASTLSAVLRDEPEPVSRIAGAAPAELERIIMRCLRKEREHRFQHMDDVKVALEELDEEIRLDRSPVLSVSSPSRRRWWLPAIALVVLLAGAVAWLLRPVPQTVLPPPYVVSLTAYPGNEINPSFSPDGKQIAFAWNKDGGWNYDIFVKLVESHPALRLTTHLAPDVAPEWSPDGDRIAFVRAAEGNRDRGTIYLISPLGGQATKLADCWPAYHSPTPQPKMSWSPDGKWLASAERESDGTNGIVLIPVGQGERRKLISGPVSAGSFGLPAFSRDGRYLAYAFANGVGMAELRLLELDNHLQAKGPPRRLTKEVSFINRIAWSPDGRSLIYSGSQTIETDYFWRISITGDGTRDRIELAGEGALFPAISAVTNRLAYSSSRNLTGNDIWTLEPAGPRKHPVSSTRGEGDPQFSPDGKRFAFVSNVSGRGGELWTANPDGTNPMLLIETTGRSVGSPRWSPDGRWIAFDGQSPDGHWDIFVIDAAGGQPRRLTPYPSDEHNPAWARSAAWIYFCSNQTGRFEIWRMPTAGGKAVQVTNGGGFWSAESFDGKSMYYTKDGVSGVYVRPVAGGVERQVLPVAYSHNFVVVRGGLYYVTNSPEGGNSFQMWFLDLVTGRSRLINRFETGWIFGLTVSPDGNLIFYAGQAPDSISIDLMLMENFR